MHKLNLPPYQFNITEKENKKQQIFDEIRRKFVALTPEEWVRQNFVKYLIEEKKFPKGLIAIEMAVDISKNTNRCDVVCFNKEAKPIVIVECKAPKVKISKEVFEQTARYNMNLQTKYVIMTNGINHYCCMIDYKERKVVYLKDIPTFSEISI
jgi:hypothetical protein